MRYHRPNVVVVFAKKPKFRLPRLRKWSFLVLITCSLIVIIFYKQGNGFHLRSEGEEILDSCKCVDANGSNYDFCYHLPENKSIYGKRFSCQYLPALKKLGLLDTSGLSSIWKQSAPVFITAFSDNHQYEALNLVKSVAQYFIDQRMIVYDLGEVNSNLFKEWKFLEFRKFNFEDYPEYVASLFEFRWKPLIIAETLLEFGAVWYMDSSVVFKKGHLNHVYELVKCRETVKQRPSLPTSEERDERENRAVHESGWDILQWRANVAECRKAAYLFHGFTGHGIYPATSPVIYEFIPTNKTEIRKPKAKMYDAGFIFAARTKDTIEQILKWYVLCALEQNCMAGEDESVGCIFEDRFSDEPTCHRYDQSVVNLLAANAFWYDRHYYVSEIVDFFNIVRGG